MIQPSKIIRPIRPMLYRSIAHHLKSFIDVEYELADVAAEEHEDNGEHQRHHRGIAPLSTAHFVVKHSNPEGTETLNQTKVT